MKHIKIFEDFRAQLNEAKETPLADGFINFHRENSEDPAAGPDPKERTAYFKTNGEDPDISVEYSISGESRELDFRGVKNWSDPNDMSIAYRKLSFKDIEPGKNDLPTTVWAKNPAEATAKAYEILAKMSHYLTPAPGDAKVMGNLIRSLFEIRKMYPEYSSKNTLFTAFLKGLESSYAKPDFGIYKNVKGNYAWRTTEDGMPAYKKEIALALKDAGVLPA